MLAALNKYLYQLDATPGPRDVAALVARFCPPETRRLPTHQIVEDEPRKPGPSTAVIQREGAARGRPRRAQTFATHVELRDMLGRGDTDDPEGPTTRVSEAPPERPSSVIGQVITDERYDPTPLPSRMPRRATTEQPIDDPDRPISRPPPLLPNYNGQSPSRALLVIVGLGGLVLTAAAVYTFYDWRDAVLNAGRDAELGDLPVLVEGSDAAPPPGDAVPRDAVPVDAAPEPDARLAHPPRDASHRVASHRDASRHDASRRDAPPRDAPPRDAEPPILPHADAALRLDAGVEGLARTDAGRASSTGAATLTIGANPWAVVYIDGKAMRAHAPARFSVTAGHHEIRVVFPAESPPIEKIYSIDIKNGETQSYQADFTH